MHHKLEYLNDGISLINDFISPEEVITLNNELDTLFSKKSSNGSLSAITLSKNTKHIMMPTLAVRSINLLELSLKVKSELEKFSINFSSYVNTEIEIIQETKNSNVLGWHTDNRKGIVRAILYIEIDEKKSGTFRYMKKSHIRDFHVDHYLNKEQVELYSTDIINCFEPSGTLIIFNPDGFHGREECLGRRRIIMFEFQPKNSNFPKSAVPLSSRNLTNNVINNLSVFLNGASNYNHGGDQYYKDPPLNLKQKIFRKLRFFNKHL